MEVRGAVSISGNIKRLRLANKKAVDILSTGNTVQPLSVELGELDESPTGNLIKIKGEITEIKSNFMYVDDGTAEAVVYFKAGSAIDKKKILEGEKVEVTGILEQAKTGLQLWPRSNEDIVSLGPSEDLLKKTAGGWRQRKRYGRKISYGHGRRINHFAFGIFGARPRSLNLGRGQKNLGFFRRADKEGLRIDKKPVVR